MERLKEIIKACKYTKKIPAKPTSRSPSFESALTSTQAKPLKMASTIPLSMVDELNRHRASFFVLIHQYEKHSIVSRSKEKFVEANLFRKRREILRQSVDDLGQRIIELGGVPVSAPSAVAETAYISHEPEKIYSLSKSIQRDKRHENQVVQNLARSIELATKWSDLKSRKLLEQCLERARLQFQQLELAAPVQRDVSYLWGYGF